MGKYFGTDGFRGEANVDLTADHAYKVGRFLGWYYNIRKPAGRTAEAFIILLGVTQVILESLREDEFIRFGFVRLNMLAAAITMGLTFFGRVYRMVKQGGWKPWQIIRLVIFALGIVLVILIEFALDKSSIDNTILYFAMAGMLALMGFAMLYDGRKKP